jgi:hypothetical protein
MRNRKNKITNLLKIGILFFSISLLFSSCEKDEFINYSPNQEKKTSYSQKTFGNIQKTEKFKEAFKKVFETKKQALNSQNRLKTVMEENYGFTIDTNAVSIISSEKYTSYTMLIHRTIDDETFYENLVIQNDSLNNTKAYILKYKLKSQLIPHEEHHSYEQDTEITVTPIIYDNTQSKMIEECRTVMVTYCPYKFEHVAGPSCYNHPERLYQKPKKECISYDDGSDNDGPGGGGATGVGGGSSTSIYTTPIISNTNPVKFFEKIFSFEDAIDYVPSRYSSVEIQFSYLGAVGKFLKLNNYAELGETLYDIALQQTTVNENEASLMVSKTVEILNILETANSFEQLSLQSQKIVTQNFLFIGFLPNLKDLGIDLPQNAEEWAEFGEFIITVLKELIPELIPGVSELNSLRNAISAFNKGSYANGSTELGFAIVGVFPVGKAWKIATKTFKGMKIVVRLTKAFKNAKKLKNLISSKYDDALKAFNKIGTPGNEGVRVLANSNEKHGKTFFEQLTKSGVDITSQTSAPTGMIIKRMPDGSKIQFRDFSGPNSPTTLSTIEFLGGNYTKKIQKIKFNN